MDRLVRLLLVELVDLEIGDRHDPGQFGHAVEEGSEAVEVAVDLDLDRLRHNGLLLGIVTR